MIPLPSQPKIIEEHENTAVFELEGLFPGYGQTIGNSFRRVLLSSLEGAAITSLKIEGVGHEFSTLEGVLEDVVEIILNIKQLRFRMHEEGPFMISLSVKGEKAVTGEDFTMPSQVELVTKNIHIATLTSKKTDFNIEATVESGLGYVPVEERTKDKVEIGIIAVDAAFSPVRHVNYEVQNMRVGDRTDYNRLQVTIETDGSLTPLEAFTSAAKILFEQFQVLAGDLRSADDEEAERQLESAVYAADAPEALEQLDDSSEEEISSVLKTNIEELKLSSRTLNVLRDGGIKTVGGLARKREDNLREIEGVGDKAVQEVKKALGNLGITLKQ